MVDHVRTLLVNPDGTPGYRKVSDAEADTVLRLFGLPGDCHDGAVVDTLLPLALAPDLERFRRFYDERVTPRKKGSVYRNTYQDCAECAGGEETCVRIDLDGLHSRILSDDGWWTVAPAFSHADPVIQADLSEMREAARSMDSAYALGAVLLACAYRRFVLQEEG